MSQVLYGERSWNPLARTVELTEDRLRRGARTTPLSELNLGAMAEAFQRGCWLGGGGAERPMERLAEGTGVIPVTRVTGTATPVRVRQAAEFARKLGELAVRRCGGPDQVAALAAQARVEGVPLWIARRFAPGPAGPITVAVDRRLVRVDVWGPHAPVVRIRAPHGFHPDVPEPSKGLRLTVDDVTAELALKKKLRKSKSSVEVRLRGQRWVLRRENAASSWLLRDERRVALLARPPRRRCPSRARFCCRWPPAVREPRPAGCCHGACLRRCLRARGHDGPGTVPVGASPGERGRVDRRRRRVGPSLVQQPREGERRQRTRRWRRLGRGRRRQRGRRWG